MEIHGLRGFVVSDLVVEDITATLPLVEEAHWNQVRADWELFLAHGSALKVCTADGTLAGTAAILPYPPHFGWISMVLVRGAYRRHGIATTLLHECVHRLRALELVPMLEATPAGRKVYRHLGFRDGWEITRWRHSGVPSALPVPPHRAARALEERDWPELAALDARAFGAGRAGLLHRLIARSQSFACVVEDAGGIAGFLLGRDGRIATQLGPIVARDEEAARALLAHALPRIGGPTLVDVLDQHEDFSGAVADAGFVIERPLVRMALDADPHFGDAEVLVAIAGPELG